MVRKFLTLLIAGVFALGVVACGDDDEPAAGGGGTETTAEPADAAPAEAGNPGLEEAKQIVDKAMSPAGTGEFPKPAEPVDAGTGTAVVINTGNICEVCKRNADIVHGVFKKIGWDIPEVRDGEFQPTVISGWIQQAVKDKVDAIVLLTVDTTQNKPDLVEATEAGVKVACVNCDISPDIAELGITDSSIDFTAEGEQMGWWVIHRSKGKGKVVIIDEPSRPPVVKRVTGTFDTIKENCPDCEVKKVTISVAETVKPGPPTWTSLLNSSPEGTITDAIPYFDGLAIPMVKTAESSGRTDVAITGYDTDPGALELMKSGDTFVGDFAIPYPYQDWSAVDQVIRAVRGKEPWDSSKMPVRLITDDNVEGYTEPFGPEGDWEGEFLKLWGKG